MDQGRTHTANTLAAKLENERELGRQEARGELAALRAEVERLRELLLAVQINRGHLNCGERLCTDIRTALGREARALLEQSVGEREGGSHDG